MKQDTVEIARPSRPMPPPRPRGPFVPRALPRAATEEPKLLVLRDHGMHVVYESGLTPGPVLGLAWQNVDDPRATALVATDGVFFVDVAKDRVAEFISRHSYYLLVPSEVDWFMELQGFPGNAWEVAPGNDAPVPAVPFVNLPQLRSALRLQNERPTGTPVAKMAQTMAYSKGAGKDEMRALQSLLETGLTANTTDSHCRLAGQAAAALWLYRLFLRRIQRRGRRRDRVMARLARYRAQMPAALQDELFGSVQHVTSAPVTAGEPATPVPTDAGAAK